MKSTHAHTTTTLFSGLHIWFSQAVLTFINEHADAFEALSRDATPVGSNWMSTR